MRRHKRAPEPEPEPVPEPEPEAERRGGGRLLKLLVLVGLIVLVSNQSVRTKVLDLLFGAEEEFEYTSMTEPVASPEPAAS
jgi:hypothetical protein